MFNFLRKWDGYNPRAPCFVEQMGRFFPLPAVDNDVLTTEEKTAMTTGIALQEFFRSLNILDYLPDEWLREEDGVRQRFDTFLIPSGVINLDVKRLGARNYILMYDAIEDLLAIIRVAEHFARERQQIVNASRDLSPADVKRLAEIAKQIELLLHELMDRRRLMLKESNAFVNSVKNKVIQICNEMGIASNDLVVWLSGDDLFVLIRSSRVATEEVTSRIMSDPNIGTDVRIAYGDIVGLNTYPLTEARTDLGVGIDALKSAEESGYQGNMAVRVNIGHSMGSNQPTYQMVTRP